MSEPRFIRHRVPAVAASALLVLGTFAGTGVLAAAPATADSAAESRRVASYEVDFLKSMVDHHTMAIMMARSCVDKAVHDELAELCQSIVDSQSAQREQMQSWLRDWYGIAYQPQLSQGDLQSMERMGNFTGAQYEIRFMQSMIRHHWAAVREGGTCVDNAEHDRLLALCETIRQTQLQEIAQMQGWLDQWYDRQGGRPASTV